MQDILIYNENGIKISRNREVKSFNLNRSDIEALAQEFAQWSSETNAFKRTGVWNRNSYIENADLPPFSQIFYLCCFWLGTAPTPSQLFYQYFKNYCEDNGDGTFKFTVPITRGEHRKALPPLETLYIGALKHRITRCYASFIREIWALHTLMSLSDKNSFHYSLVEDIYHDTDIVGVNGENKYSISLYNRSKSSSAHREEKEIQNSGKLSDYSTKIKVEADVFNHINTEDIGYISVYSQDAMLRVVDLVKTSKTGTFVI